MTGLRLVVLGMMGACPFGGQTWLYLNWLASLSRLGHEVWYVEDNQMWQYDPRANDFTETCEYAVGHVARSVASIGLEGRWMYRFGGRCWGGSVDELRELYRTCDALLNVCGATELGDDHLLSKTRVWIETDPVVDELRIAAGDDRVRRQMLELHQLHATYGENYGAPDCPVPLHGVSFVKTRQPVDLDLWPDAFDPGARFVTTVANYRTVPGFAQDGYDAEYDGETFTWSKHHEFERFLDLPARTQQPFQLALRAEPADVDHLRDHGWGVVPALPMTLDAHDYQRFIQGSRAQFTVAKDQNIRMRSGWFSERDACYLASGKPVVTQDTAFPIPTGEGLFAVRTVDEAAAAFDAVNAEYPRHAHAARALAEEHFEGRAVARRLLSDLGLA